MTKELYEEMQEGYYDKAYREGSSVQKYWNTNRFKKIIDKIVKLKPKNIIDIGCGPGTLLSLIPKRVYSKATGIDFDKKQTSFSKKKFKNNKKIKWISGDVTKLKTKQKYDCIISSEVIEHIEPEKSSDLLKAMNKLLRKNGTLIITTPNYRSLWPIIEWFVNRLGDVDYSEQHINKLNIKTLSDQLKNNKFIIKEAKTFYIISPFLSVISPKLSRFIQKIEETILPRLGSIIIIEAKKI